mmetsp:Transcript_23577/g.67036  ORF Transcript_23577/g.67036 Transcript_23577/m.67036 type:complete len:212 (+) Transcript_23577:375-1010(+)
MGHVQRGAHVATWALPAVLRSRQGGRRGGLHQLGARHDRCAQPYAGSPLFCSPPFLATDTDIADPFSSAVFFSCVYLRGRHDDLACLQLVLRLERLLRGLRLAVRCELCPDSDCVPHAALQLRHPRLRRSAQGTPLPVPRPGRGHGRRGTPVVAVVAAEPARRTRARDPEGGIPSGGRLSRPPQDASPAASGRRRGEARSGLRDEGALGAR